MKGWEPIPSALIGDTRLSLQTRAVYALLRNLIWQETRASEDTMTATIGTVDDIARAAGCSVTAMKTYIRELREAGWVGVSRSRRGHPFTFTVFSTATKPESDSVAEQKSEPESASVQGRNPTHSRERDPLPSNGSDGVDADASTRERDLVWEILEEHFGRVVSGTSAHGCRSKAVADLKLLGATADSIRFALDRAVMLDKRWAASTDVALAKHYPHLTVSYSPPAPRNASDDATDFARRVGDAYAPADLRDEIIERFGVEPDQAHAIVREVVGAEVSAPREEPDLADDARLMHGRQLVERCALLADDEQLRDELARIYKGNLTEEQLQALLTRAAVIRSLGQHEEAA